MKKIALLAFASAAMLCASETTAQEVTYVEDCSQGVLINKAKDNWFITLEGGANFLYGHNDIHADIKDRIGAQAGIYVGKWFTPVVGARFGGRWLLEKGACPAGGEFLFHRNANPTPSWDGIYYGERRMNMGAELGLMVSLTNWWCGYNPDRVYNSVLRGSGAFYWSAYRGKGHNGSGEIHWRNDHNTFLSVSLGWQNNFRLSKHVEIFIEPRAELLDLPSAEGVFSLNAGVTFNLGKTDWSCPVTAVCPTWKYTDAEGDALVAKLASANQEVKEITRKYDECMRRPVAQKVADCEGLATIYYPINQYGLSNREKTILKSVASVMNDNPNKTYELVGWADNFTGTPQINENLRWNRVNGVKNFLVKCGVNPDQLSTEINNGSLADFSEPSTASLDRAVTIREKK